MNYRIYIKEDGRYSFPYILNDVMEIITAFDKLILKGEIKEMIVVKHDKKLHMDETFYTYSGDIDEYIVFKEKILLEQDKVLEPYYEFVKIKNK